MLVLIRIVSYDTHVAFCLVRNDKSTDFETDGVSEGRQIVSRSPSALVVFKAVPSSQRLVSLNGLLTRYQGPSWLKQAYVHKYSAAYQEDGSTYSRYLTPPQQPSSN